MQALSDRVREILGDFQVVFGAWHVEINTMVEVQSLSMLCEIAALDALFMLSEKSSSECAKKTRLKLQTEYYSSTSKILLQKIVKELPSRLTNELLNSLVSYDYKHLNVSKCTKITYSGMEQILTK